MMSKRHILALGGSGALAAVAGGCVRVQLSVDPIQIYAQLDANVRIQLDQELRQLLEENPNLF